MNISTYNTEVTVVMAVRNEQTHVESAVKSILRQTGVTFELRVVDDNSTDGTYEILSRLSAEDSRMYITRNPKSGKCSAFNLGVKESVGRFTCICAGDDIMPEGSLAARYAAVKDLPDNVPVVGLCKLVTMSEVKKFDGHLIPRGRGRGSLSGVSPLMNRLACSKIFPVPESLPNEDTWMGLCITNFSGWQILHSDIVGCAWRVHEGNSINMMIGFDEYNKKISARRQALPMFYARFGAELDESRQTELHALIECEERRLEGRVFGILCSRVSLVDKLRMLSTANRLLYGIRQKLYGLLSGW